MYRTPTVQSYRNYTVVGMGMPSSGGATMGLMLNMLYVSLRFDSFQPYRYCSFCEASLVYSKGLTFHIACLCREEFDIPGSFVPVSRELYHRLIDIQDVAFADRNSFMVRSALLSAVDCT